MLRLLRRRYRVRVGDDGVQVWRLFERARFIAYREMSLAKREGNNAVLRARNGTRLELACRDEAAAHAFVEDVNDRIAVVRRATDAAARERLRRNGRSVDAWLASLPAAAPPDVASYRALATPNETLWEILEDPAAPPTARAAAAFALRGLLGAEGRARVTRVAAGCAEPRLRTALDAIASAHADGDAVVRALAAVEDGG